MKRANIFFTGFFIVLSLAVQSQDTRWNWSLQYSFTNNNPIFTFDNALLQEEFNGSSTSHFGNTLAVQSGYVFNEKLTFRCGLGYRSMSYKNDSINVEKVTLIESTTRGIEIPLTVDYQLTDKGWILGLGGLYYVGLKDLLSYQLLNNNQRQSHTANSELKGVGYQLSLSKVFMPDEKHILSMGIVGQHYPNVLNDAESQMGYLNIGLRLGLIFQ